MAACGDNRPRRPFREIFERGIISNTYRWLAPITEGAWAQIEAEARRTFITRLAGRRVVDVPEAGGAQLSSVDVGHVESVDPAWPGVQTRRRVVQPLVELRVPFELSREAIDDVDRGAEDSDWQPVKTAVETLAAAEDTLVSVGSEASSVLGIIPSSSNPVIKVGEGEGALIAAVASAVTQLRTVGVQGPYAVMLSPDLYTLVGGGTDNGYPLLEHLRRILGDDGVVAFAPTLSGAIVLTMRGGDYTLTLGEDVRIGYLSHDAHSVQLYVQESVTFRVNTAEASVVLEV